MFCIYLCSVSNFKCLNREIPAKFREDTSTMGKGCAARLLVPGLFAFCLGAAGLRAQQPPQPTQLPGDIFVIKNTWFIGGAGAWDYLTMDTTSNRLFIAHDSVVQVVDVETGAVAGQVTGLHQAHDVVLDSAGQFGYVSDGLVNQVKIFDRQSLQVVASIATGPGPRALAFDPQTGLLFVVCTTPLTEDQQAEEASIAERAQPPHAPAPTAPRRTTPRTNVTSISVIDVTARRRIGEILMPGRLGFAQADGNGQLFVLIADRNQVARIDAGTIASLLHVQPDAAASTVPADGPQSQSAAKPAPAYAVLDWSRESRPPDSAAMQIFRLGSACRAPLALAVDGAHQRVFAACDNMSLTVLNGGTGEVVTTLPIGPGPEAVGYDAGRGLIYTANGDAQGTLTIIRQDVTDTYNVIQNLATRQRARTLAVDPDTGQVYLVTDYVGVNLSTPGGIGTLKSAPVAGSFQVLAVGH